MMKTKINEDQIHSLTLVYEEAFDRIKGLKKKLEVHRKQSPLGVKEEVRQYIHLLDSIDSLNDMVLDITQGNETTVCNECDGVWDHEDGCKVDWEEQQEAKACAPPTHFDPRDGSVW
ncbi:MAG: hypothetical protein KAJ19_29240 [Gammaproteobacteria bacterium]|nr:hypothetical protein [Gammaproteobacteria bacterium]